MKRAVCSVFDSASMLYGNPLFVPSVGQAVRSFTDEVNRVGDDNVLNKHPADFMLLYIADFDDAKGVFELPPGGSQIVARGVDVLLLKE